MTTVHVNTSVEVSEAVVKRLQREVDHLRSMLNAAGISSTAAAGAGAAAVRVRFFFFFGVLGRASLVLTACVIRRSTKSNN